MAKIDLRMQFNEQCFLINNPGVVHRGVKLTLPGATIAQDQYVYYLDKSATSLDLSPNAVQSNSAWLYQNYFDEFRKNSMTGLKSPGVYFKIYKSYPKGGASSTEYEDVEIPVAHESAFKKITYEDTDDERARPAFKKNIGEAKVQNLRMSFTGKDFAHSNVVECDLTIECQSLQSLLRSFRRPVKGGDDRYVSISDLIRMPSKKTERDYKNVVRAHLPRHVLSSAQSIRTVLGRHHRNKARRDQFQRADAECPIAQQADTSAIEAPNPDFYQIKIEWGYPKDHNGQFIASNPHARQVLTQQVYLNLLSYGIKYEHTGKITLTLQYVGRAAQSLDDVRTNLLTLDKEKETTIDKLRQIASVFQNIKGRAAKQPNINFSSDLGDLADIILSIPGIKNDKSLVVGLLRPLWLKNKDVEGDKTIAPGGVDPATGTRGGLASALTNITDMKDVEYYGKLASFMENRIDHYLASTRQERYEALQTTLIKHGRAVRVLVPFDYLGFKHLDSIKAWGSTLVGNSATHKRQAGKNKNEIENLQKAAKENAKDAAIYRSMANAEVITNPDPAKTSGKLRKMLNSVRVIRSDSARRASGHLSTLNAMQKNREDREAAVINQTGQKDALATDEKTVSVSQAQREAEFHRDDVQGHSGKNVKESDTIVVTRGQNQKTMLLGMRNVTFTTIGHVLEAACSIAGLAGITNRKAGLPDIRIVLAPLEVKHLFKQVRAVDWDEDDMVIPDDLLIQNIGDVPVSLTLLNQFWQEKVVQRGREVYTLGEFIKELITFFMAHTFGSECNVFNRMRQTIVGVDYVKSNHKMLTDSPIAKGARLTSAANYTETLKQEEIFRKFISWPADWKRPMIKNELKKIYDNSINLKPDSVTYLIVRVRNFSLDYLDPGEVIKDGLRKNTGQKRSDGSIITKPSPGKYGIPVLRPPSVANSSGKMKKLEFKRSEAKFVREARLTRNNNFHNDMLRDIYDVHASILGSPSFKPGGIIYVDPTIKGGSWSADPILTRSTINNTLGLGGFYIITEAVHNIVQSGERKYFTELTAIWNSFGGCEPVPVNVEQVVGKIKPGTATKATKPAPVASPSSVDALADLGRQGGRKI